MATEHQAKSPLAQAWGWQRARRVRRVGAKGFRGTWKEGTSGLGGGHDD